MRRRPPDHAHLPRWVRSLREPPLSRILIASQPIAGHLLPLLPIAAELVRRGHQVRWYTGRKYARQVEATGAVLAPFVQARDYDDAELNAQFPGRDRRRGLRQIQFDVRQVFVGQIEAQLRDLQDLQASWPAEVVLAEQTMFAALLLSELGGPPCALLGILPLGIPSRDTAPFGLGLRPSRSPAGRLRNHALQWTAQQLIFGDSSRELQRLCRRLGVTPRGFSMPVSPHLMMQATVASFEYPLSDLPPQLHFIGPVAPVPGTTPLPPWWPEVLASERPLVLVTQGTLATDARQLIRPALEGLAGEDLLVVAAGVRDPGVLGPLPANARVAAYLPFGPLLPQVAVYVTNGGYGGVQQALSCGVPVVVAGSSEDKAEVANRVQHAGVGLNLHTSRPSPAQVARAVRALLPAGPQRQRAAALGQEMRQRDAVREAASLVERLARSGTPVLRESPGP